MKINMKSLSLFIKRSFDILTSILLLVLLSPIFIVISMMIWITMGKPIFYKQMRLGYQGKQFKIIKFRTMDELWDQDEILLPDDQRMTKTGKLLRSTPLDELPGLINIFLTMDPEDVGEILNNVEEDTANKVIEVLKEKDAG